MERQKTTNGYTLALNVLLVFILIAGAAACVAKSSAEQAPPPLPSLPVFAAREIPASTYQEFTASLEGSRDIEIRPQVSGILTAIYVDEGAYVRKGQVLFSIDSRGYKEEKNRAHANLSSAKAALQSAQINVERLIPLVNNDVVSETELRSARAAQEQARANVAQAQAAESAAAINVGYTELRAPADGYIGPIPYKTGSLVSGASPDALTVLSDTRQMYVYFSMSEMDFMRFKSTVPGNTLEEKIAHIPPVTLLLADNSVYPQKGKLALVQGQFNKSVGAISFRAIFPNEKGLLRSGNTGRIRIPDQQVTGLVIPQEATFEIQDKTFVLVVGDSNKVASQPIAVQKTIGRYYITRSGIKAGDKIVYAGFDRLADGDKIRQQPISLDSLLQASPIE